MHALHDQHHFSVLFIIQACHQGAFDPINRFIALRFRERTSIFGGYRYNGSSDVKFDTLEAEYDAHEIRVGLAYAF